MRGSLRSSSLAELLRHLYAERKSGVLHLAQEGIQRRIHLKKGLAIFADSPDSALLSREQSEELLYSLFTWISGDFHFQEVEPEIDEARALTASASATILEGSRRIADLQVLEHFLGGPESVFACAQTSVLPLFTMKLSPTESAILKLARERGKFRARDLPSRGLEIARALNALLSVGLLEVVEKAAVAAPRPAVPPPDPTPTPPPILSPVVAPRPSAAVARVALTPPPPPLEEPPESPEVEAILRTFPVKRVEPSPPPPPPLPPPRTVESEAREAAPLELPAPVETRPTPPPKELPPQRRNWVLGASLAAAALAIALVLLFLRGRDERASSTAVVAAGPAPTDAALPAPSPPDVPEAAPEIPPEPSVAERFYAANVAFEKKEYEQAKAELTALLERQPDFGAAHELMARVERELAPKPRVVEAPVRKLPEKQPEPEPEPWRTPEPVAPAASRASELFEAAKGALARSDFPGAQAQLEALEALDPAYPGAGQLKEELRLRSWERTLPLSYGVRHDHALGSCTGILQLTSKGYGFRSKEHEWVLSFAEVAETERRDPQRLRIETTNHTSYNFELAESPSDADWKRHQTLGKR